MQRNGYGLADLVERSLSEGKVTALVGGDEQDAMVGHAVGEATGRQPKKKKKSKKDVSGEQAVVLGARLAAPIGVVRHEPEASVGAEQSIPDAPELAREDGR